MHLSRRPFSVDQQRHLFYAEVPLMAARCLLQENPQTFLLKYKCQVKISSFADVFLWQLEDEFFP